MYYIDWLFVCTQVTYFLWDMWIKFGGMMNENNYWYQKYTCVLQVMVGLMVFMLSSLSVETVNRKPWQIIMQFFWVLMHRYRLCWAVFLYKFYKTHSPGHLICPLSIHPSDNTCPELIFLTFAQLTHTLPTERLWVKSVQWLKPSF